MNSKGLKIMFRIMEPLAIGLMGKGVSNIEVFLKN
jgi:hypothetical protein